MRGTYPFALVAIVLLGCVAAIVIGARENAKRGALPVLHLGQGLR